MRTVMVVLVGLMLLFSVGQASAVDNGTADPLGLIASAAVVPFWANFTLIEVTYPGPFAHIINNLHVVYFDHLCNRLISRPHVVTSKGAIIFSPDAEVVTPAGAGLAVIAKTADNFNLEPIPPFFAIHVRGFWFDLAADFIHVVDPIAVSSPDSAGQTWSPMRSAASFGAPINAGPWSTTIHLICPSTTIIGGLTGLAAGKFPVVRTAFSTSAANGIRGILYDGDEHPIANFDLFCICQTMFELSSITSLYGSATALGPELLSYTELFTYQPTLFVPLAAQPAALQAEARSPRTFVGYRAITVNHDLWNPTGDDFGRMNNGSAFNYRVNGAGTLDNEFANVAVPIFQRFPALR